MPETIQIRATDALAIFRVHSWDPAADPPAATQEVLRAPLPRTVGSESASDIAQVICIGPTEWLILHSHADSLSESQVATAFLASSFRWANISAALVGLEIEGSRARTLLSKGCGLDFHPRHFPASHAARTRFAGIPVVLRCRRQDQFQCLVSRSFSDYLLRWLTDAALEFR